MGIVASAPGRVNLIGEHTDYNGGRCLPFAIPLRTTAELVPRTDRTVHIRSRQRGTTTCALDDLAPGSVPGWAAYVAGVLWALASDGWPLSGYDVTIDGAVPLGAGLSSSAALECAVATAVAAHHGHALDRPLRQRLARSCVRAETEFVGAPTGGMDQAVAMLGTAGHALLLDFADHSDRTVPLPLTEAGLTVLVVDTGAPHGLADGAGGYAERRTECGDAAAALGVPTLRDATVAEVARLDDPVFQARARHVVTEERRVDAALAAVEAADWTALGEVLTAAHLSLRDDFEVSTPALDLCVETAVEAGALGARLVGGGFGGSAIALAPVERVDAVRRAVDAAFAGAGQPRPTHHAVTPAAGAAVTAAEE